MPSAPKSPAAGWPVYTTLPFVCITTVGAAGFLRIIPSWGAGGQASVLRDLQGWPGSSWWYSCSHSNALSVPEIRGSVRAAVLLCIVCHQATFSVMKLATRGHQHCSGKKGQKRQNWVAEGIKRSLFTNCTAAKAQDSRFQAGVTHPERPAALGVHSREEEIPHHQKPTELSCSC